ncbi:hypothetical protein TMatcc_001421 [Talaromyces marneffei ATCC 18224]|uniref:Integral membrane protein n=2 Tax=Talaromyces marneffei TaxID=37727 RepID=B6QK41_TALMQ|nr:uncharacterized protein EYB26_007347 [Talaromyces marneffei]EEA22573.1 integral membrane protein [Talaromyces marneffei ATCC 18224]KAE8551469.1 hypothetical protein EYB25_005359 [Talaromyces marneffei]QGA19658.1 hypothetical protein EYB26_007347 [Talaromyces marneffei]
MALQEVTFPVKPIVKIHFIINCVLVLITLVVVGLRLVSRLITSAGLGWDDYLILIAVPEALGMFVIQGLCLPMGVGFPITDTLPNLVVLLKLMLSYAMIYNVCISTVKISVLCFYLRIFVNKYLRIATMVVGGFVLSWTTANILMLFLICRPFRANYDPLLARDHCGDQKTAFMSIGVFNIISDIMICLLPLPTIWGLKARQKMKITLTGLFTISFVVCAVAAGRIAAFTRFELSDLTGTMIWVDFLSTTETSLGILCVSLPMLGPIVGRLGKGKSSAYDSRSWPNQYSNGGSKAMGSKFSSKKQQPGVDTIILNSIDAADEHDHEHEHVLYTGNAETSSQHGSEASLNPASRQQAPIGIARG